MGDNDKNATIWFHDSDPYDFVRAFARKEDVDEPMIRKMFAELSISSLRNVQENSKRVCDLMPNNISHFFHALYTALNQCRESAEVILGQAKIVYDGTCILDEAYEWYTPAAVSVMPLLTANEFRKRHSKFSIVLGSSGSGKTLFAMRRIPELLFGEDVTKYFRIHFDAHMVMDNMRRVRTCTFPMAVALLVEDVVAKKLTGRGLDNVTEIGIPLHVTIDEGGGGRIPRTF
jgi:hypothetical protein